MHYIFFSTLHYTFVRSASDDLRPTRIVLIVLLESIIFCETILIIVCHYTVHIIARILFRSFAGIVAPVKLRKHLLVQNLVHQSCYKTN